MKKRGWLKRGNGKKIERKWVLFFVKLLIRGVCRVIEIRLVKHGGLIASKIIWVVQILLI